MATLERRRGLWIRVGNHPRHWRFQDDENDFMPPNDGVVEVAIFATMDSPVEVHLLCVDRDAWRDENLRSHVEERPWDRTLFEYQLSYEGYDVFASNWPPPGEADRRA